MTLYDEIIEEQEGIAEEAKTLATELMLEARQAIVEGELCPPVVAGITAGDTNYYYPTWRNDFERGKVFNSINANLASHETIVTVATFHGKYALTAPGESPRDHPEAIPAIILVLRTYWGSSALIHPYRKDGTEIEWLESVPLETYNSDITHPCVN